MRIEDAIKRIHSLPNCWVRVEQIRRVPGGLELQLGVYKGRRGKKVNRWQVRCLGVREFQIPDVDGGGLALYSGSHPAARQFTARQAVLRWDGGDDTATIGALWKAHRTAVDDWISFGHYVDIRAIAEKKFICRGPDFLMRAYANALRLAGAHPELRLRPKRRAKIVGPKVLHFGSSCVVACAFIALCQA